jgi:hypothetical protein
MKFRLMYFVLAVSLLAVSVLTSPLSASAHDVVLPAGTLLQCTLNEPNFSSKTADVGDPVLCHLKGVSEFGQQAFPRGSYLVGHLESAKDPGHFWGKGYLKLQFDRIGLPTGDLPIDAKVIGSRNYKVDKQGKIDGKGHAKRDVVEWMLPPLWPWKVIMLPARGPRPTLKGETPISLRLMDDVDIPQVAQTYGPNWHFFGRFQNNSFDAQVSAGRGQVADASVASGDVVPAAAPQLSYAANVSLNVSRELPSNVVSLPGMPVFVLTNGSVLSVSGYGYRDNRISYTLIGGGSGVISTDEIDWTTTTRLNNQRGVHMTLHGGRANPEAPGF